MSIAGKANIGCSVALMSCSASPCCDQTYNPAVLSMHNGNTVQTLFSTLVQTIHFSATLGALHPVCSSQTSWGRCMNDLSRKQQTVTVLQNKIIRLLQVAQALGITLPGTNARKRKATAAQTTKTLQSNIHQQPQQQPSALPASAMATAVATAQPPAVKKPRRGAVKPPLLGGESLSHRSCL